MSDDVSSSELLLQLETKTARAAQEMLPAVYAELRSVAALLLSHERRDHTLQPTALVHEAYLRLAREIPSDVDVTRARQRFVALAARAMRRILVDHARHRGRGKRGGGFQRVALTESLPIAGAEPCRVLDLESALEQLEARSARLARVAELRLFAGLTFEETAESLGTSPTSVKRDWKIAQALLSQSLRAGDQAGA